MPDIASFEHKALTKEDLTLGNRSEFEKISNISDRTSDNLADFAKSNETYIILRPVNPVAFDLMQNGAVGKTMHVHGKSAEKGPAMGLIPTSSSISKAGKDNNATNIAKFNQENLDSIHHSTEAFDRIQTSVSNAYKEMATSSPELDVKQLLEKAGIGEEDFKQVIIPVDLKDKKGNQIYIFENPKGIALQDETKNHIYAIKEGDQFFGINENHEKTEVLNIPTDFKQVAVQVFGQANIIVGKDGTVNIDSVKPITADIDALAYGTKAEQSFSDISSYKEMLAAEKQKIVENSGFELTDTEKKLLREDHVEKLPDSLKSKPEIKDLLDDLKKQEVLMDHLRGMGDGTDVTHSITGQLRADFKDTIEISHGAEQFNLNFTQGLDKEWIIIKPTGEKMIAQGEDKLIEVFNEARQGGYSMPPNPNWGWKLDSENNFTKDPTHKKLFDDIAQASSIVGSENPKEQKDQIKELLSKRLELGKLAVTSTPPEEQEKMTKLTTELQDSLTSYKDRFISRPAEYISPSKITTMQRVADIESVVSPQKDTKIQISKGASTKSPYEIAATMQKLFRRSAPGNSYTISALNKQPNKGTQR